MTVRSIELTSGIVRPLNVKSVTRTSYYRLAILAGACLFLAAMSRPSLGAPINYPGHVGTTVIYSDVSEDANSAGDVPPLFGAPIYSGDSVDFNPVGFDANASGAGGVDITDGNLRMVVTAKPGNAIANFNLSEAGDTTLAGFGTNTTMTSVTATGTLDIYDVDGVGINNISVPFSLTFTPFNGLYRQGTEGGGGPFFHTQWFGSQLLNINQVLINAGKTFVLGATRIAVDLDNTLVAVSEAGTSSLIAKKDFGGISITINQPGPGGGDIPEPTSVILAILGLVGLGISRRSGR